MRSCAALFLIAFTLTSGSLSGQVLRGRLNTEKGETRETLSPHRLSWWTKNPLRLDSSRDLMLGAQAPDGLPLTLKDYTTEQTITRVGVLAGRTILQVQTSIHPGSRVIAAGFASKDSSAGEWKDLLVSSREPGMYLDLYALHDDIGGLFRSTKAQVFGSGTHAILGSYDPDTGNGGGCMDGYWWFDSRGPHDVDFSPLLQAINRVIPVNATYTSRCWALHPSTSELKSAVQRGEAECHACADLGEVRASYKIEHGIAKPMSVHLEPVAP